MVVVSRVGGRQSLDMFAPRSFLGSLKRDKHYNEVTSESSEAAT